MKRPLHVQRRHYLYVRVSTDDQVRDGVSLQAQAERLKAYAVATERHYAELVVDDGVSAKSICRKGLSMVLDSVRSGGAASVVVLKLDRLTRSVRDLADILDIFTKANTALVSVTESLDTATASGRLMLNLLASVSQWEREAIGERTAFALAHKRRNGAVYGPVPFGYRREGGVLVRDTASANVLQAILERRSQGQSVRSICTWLNENAIPTPRGRRTWFPNTLHQVLTSKIAQERDVGSSAPKASPVVCNN